MFKIKFSFSYKIGVLLLIGIIIILLEGYFSYKSLSSVLRLMQQEKEPQYGLVTIKNINALIQQAENNIRLYSITKENIHLKNYKKFIQEIDSNFNRLDSQYPEDEWFESKIDTISWLLESKAQIWDEMILLSRTDSTDEVFSELTAELKNKEDDLGKDRKLFERIFKSRKKDQVISSSEILEKLNKIERSEKVIEQSLLMKETELTATSHLLN
ncbi:MAG: CHASE3 domain-containing protein, partial [Bacteroidales bacterium]|nr:CHASE3 domain-containing protein [Bacteroidales bacterium]